MPTIKPRVRRSEKLSPEEHAAFKAWVDAQSTKLDAAELLDTSRITLDAVYLKGSGKPETIVKVRSVLPAPETTQAA